MEEFRDAALPQFKAQSLSLGAKRCLSLRRGCGERAQEPHSVFFHEASGAHAGKQRDFGVIVHHLIARLHHQLVVPLLRIIRLGYALRGKAQVDRLAAQRGSLAQLAHLRQQGDRRMQSAILQVRMGLVVVQPGAAAHECALHREVLHLTRGVEVEGPEDGGAVDVGKQRGPILGELRRVQTGWLIGQVNGLPAREGFGLQLGARFDESGDIGNGVQHAVAAIAGFDEDCLVQIHGSGRINSHQRDVAGIAALLSVAVLR